MEVARLLKRKQKVAQSWKKDVVFSLKCYRFCGFSKFGGSGNGICKVSPPKTTSCTVLEKKKRFFPEAVPFLWSPRIWGVRQCNLQGFSIDDEKLHSSRKKTSFS